MIKTNETTDKINQCIQDDFFKCYMRSQPKDRIIEFLDIKNKLESFHIFQVEGYSQECGIYLLRRCGFCIHFPVNNLWHSSSLCLSTEWMIEQLSNRIISFR